MKTICITNDQAIHIYKKGRIRRLVVNVDTIMQEIEEHKLSKYNIVDV